jgi:hypothetical protein
MGDKKKKTKVEETTVTPQSHWLRSMLILLVAAALSFGVWYLVSDRD